MVKSAGCRFEPTSRKSFNDFPFEMGADPLKTSLHFIVAESDFQTSWLGMMKNLPTDKIEMAQVPHDMAIVDHLCEEVVVLALGFTTRH